MCLPLILTRFPLPHFNLRFIHHVFSRITLPALSWPQQIHLNSNLVQSIYHWNFIISKIRLRVGNFASSRYLPQKIGRTFLPNHWVGSNLNTYAVYSWVGSMPNADLFSIPPFSSSGGVSPNPCTNPCTDRISKSLAKGLWFQFRSFQISHKTESLLHGGVSHTCENKLVLISIMWLIFHLRDSERIWSASSEPTRKLILN